MRIYHNQLTNTLCQGFKPVWLIFGDEPWQKDNALAQIRSHYQQQGFEERISFSVDDKFDWSLVIQEYQSMSLFANLRIIELELSSLKIGDHGSNALSTICEMLNQDTVLIIHAGKIDAAGQKRKWFKLLDKQGVFLPIYEIEDRHLQQWLRNQAKNYQINLDNDVFLLLQELFSGNLLALDQELQKFAILFNQQLITLNDAEPLLVKQAKFNPFQLIDSLLLGNLQQVYTQLDSLQHDGTAINQLVWFVHKEISLLLELQNKLGQGANSNDLFKQHRIWDKRKPLYNKALKTIKVENLMIALARLSEVDLVSKSNSDFNAFILLADVITSLYHGEKLNSFSLAYDL